MAKNNKSTSRIHHPVLSDKTLVLTGVVSGAGRHEVSRFAEIRDNRTGFARTYCADDLYRIAEGIEKLLYTEPGQDISMRAGFMLSTCGLSLDEIEQVYAYLYNDKSPDFRSQGMSPNEPEYRGPV